MKTIQSDVSFSGKQSSVQIKYFRPQGTTSRSIGYSCSLSKWRLYHDSFIWFARLSLNHRRSSEKYKLTRLSGDTLLTHHIHATPGVKPAKEKNWGSTVVVPPTHIFWEKHKPFLVLWELTQETSNVITLTSNCWTVVILRSDLLD